MKKTTILTIAILACACLAQTQFSVAATGSHRDEAQSTILSSGGGYVSTGYTMSYGAGSHELLLIKHSSDGDILWATTVGGIYSDNGSSVYPTGDGGYMVCGTTANFDLGYTGPFFVKFSAAGVMEWAKRVESPYYEYGYCGLQTSDNGYFFLCNTSAYGSSGNRIFLVKLTSAGAVDWAKVINGAGDDQASWMIATADGGYALVGNTTGSGAGGNDLFILKLDSSFNVQWAKAVGGIGEEYGMSILQAGDGGYVLTGHTNSFGGGSYDFLLTKLNSAGELQWATSVGGSGAEYSSKAIQIGDGKFVVVGKTESFGAGSGDIFVTKFNSSGAFQWAKTIGRTSDDKGNALVATPDGGFALSGSIEHWDSSDNLLLAKFDNTDYNCLAVSASPTTRNLTDSLEVASATPSGELGLTINVHDVSPTTLSVTFPDSFLCGDVGIEEDNLPKDFALSAWPNPFNSAVTIALDAPVGAHGRAPLQIEIFDISGRRVAQLSDRGTVGAGLAPALNDVADNNERDGARPSPTACEFTWTPDETLSSGVYLVRARFDGRGDLAPTGQTAVQRVVYLK